MSRRECAGSVETHNARTAPLPEASHRCRLGKELDGEGPVTQPFVSETEMRRPSADTGTVNAHGAVANLSSETRVKPAGQALGVCERVQVARGPEGHLVGLLENSINVPPHLQDLWQRSSACLSREQGNEV